MIKCLSPLKTEQVPIFDSDRDLPEDLLEIKLDKEGAGPCLYEVTNSAGECFVENRGFRVRDSIVDGRASRPRKVVYAPDFGGSFLYDCAERRASKVRKRRLREGP